MFFTASSSGMGCSPPSRTAREKRSPWIVYWSHGANSFTSTPEPKTSEPSSMNIRVGRSGGGPKLAAAARANQLDCAEPLRVCAHHERLLNTDARAVAHGEEFARLGGARGYRLLAEDVLSRLCGLRRPGHVQVIRQGVVDG